MSYTHLTESDRHKISHLNSAGFSLREIARRINRHHTTISRELQGKKYEKYGTFVLNVLYRNTQYKIF